MLINRLRLQRFGNLEDIDLDLTPYRGMLVAIEGRNGSGKSHLVEAMIPAALYRRVLSYGDWVQGHFHEEQSSYIDVSMTHKGHEYQIIIHGKKDDTPECFLYMDGISQAGPGVREFDEHIRRHFPPQEVTLATHFAAQNAVHGFFAMDQKDRMIVFQSLLGLDDHSRWVTALTEATKTHKIALREAKARIEGMDRTGITEAVLSELRKQEGAFGGEISTLERIILRLDDQMSELQSKYRAVSDEHRAIIDRFTRAQALDKDISALKKSIANLDHQPKSTTMISDEEVLQQELRVKALGEAKVEAEGHYSGALRAYDASKRLVTELQKKRDRGKEMDGVDLSIEMCQKCPLTAGFERWSQPDEEMYLGIIKAQMEQLDGLRQAEEQLKALKDDLQEAHEKLKVFLGIRKHQWDAPTELSTEPLRRLLADHLTEVGRLLDAGIDFEPAANEMKQLSEKMNDVSTSRNQAEMRLITVRDLWGRARNDIARAEVQLAQRSGEEAAVMASATAIEDCQVLTDLVGRDRRQHIDQALPLIQSHCNKFLEPYQNGRFTIQLQSMHKKKSSEDFRESFQPIIIDGLTGTSRLKASVGECAILSEALRMATLTANVILNGAEGGTLARDEMTANIDVENLGIYMDILRSGLKEGIFTTQFFVCHAPHILEQADVIIHLDKGRVSSIED